MFPTQSFSLKEEVGRKLIELIMIFLHFRLEFFKHFAGEDMPKKSDKVGEVEPMNEQFNNVAELGPGGDAADVEIR